MKKSTKQLDRDIDQALARRRAHAAKARRDARIAKNGQGGFLDPPEYPSHEYHVETDLRRRPGNRGGMSLDYAVNEAPWLDPETKREAKALLDRWKTNQPPLSSPKVQDWIHQVLGYFRNSYGRSPPGIPESKRWHVENLSIDPDADPVLNADLHAGVHLIRKFYPEFTPTRQDFERAYWGRR